MSRYEDLTRDELATLVPELLLMGQLIDRSGMAWCIKNFGREEMLQIAIEEWAASSPVYTKRMQRALDYVGTDVITIFKGLQLDIGAPPQFMDFRYQIQDPNHGTFHLDHCGALLDVEPMGDDYVKGMCHDIEDPTFDATAVATNPKARMRPVHRPPRRPADRHPHCAWTVFIDESLPDRQPFAGQAVIELTEAARLALAAIDPADPGESDYSGVLVSDLDFHGFSHSALVRIANEVALQMHLLNLAFRLAVSVRTEDPGVFDEVTRKQAVGHAGVAAERLLRALNLPATPEGAARLLELHPVFNPVGYVDVERSGATLRLSASPAHRDGAWVVACSPGRPEVLQAAVRAVDPHFDVEITGTDTDWTATVVRTGHAAPEAPEVQVAKFSKGAGFEFEPRKSLPLTVL